MQLLTDRQRLEREIPILGARGDALNALHEESRRGSDRYGAALAGLEAYCFFIGYPRSGHSLLGAFLDAHPDIVMAHELNVLKFMDAGFDRRQLEYLLIENARRCAAAGRSWGPFCYAVEEQWQGRFRTIKVLGDKKGGSTTRRILIDKRKLAALDSLFEGRTKFIHVVRNPFDTISTLFLKGTAGKLGPIRQDLFGTARIFFELAETNVFIRGALGETRVLCVRYEDLVEDPEATLTAVGGFLGVGMEPDYLDACARILAPSPSRSREKVSWPPLMIELVTKKSRSFDFLGGYSFED